MRDQLYFPHRDARDGVRVVQSILDCSELTKFLERTKTVEAALQEDFKRLEIGNEAYEKRKDVTCSLVRDMSSDNIKMCVLENALSELSRMQKMYTKRQKAWNELVVNPNATSVAARYHGPNMAEVKVKAYQVLLAVFSIIDVVKEWPVFDADHKKLAGVAEADLNKNVRWIESNPGFDPVLLGRTDMFDCAPSPSVLLENVGSTVVTGPAVAEVTKPADRQVAFGPSPDCNPPPTSTSVQAQLPASASQAAIVLAGPGTNGVIPADMPNASRPPRVPAGAKLHLAVVGAGVPTDPV